MLLPADSGAYPGIVGAAHSKASILWSRLLGKIEPKLQVHENNSSISRFCHADPRRLRAFACNVRRHSSAGWRLPGGNTAEGQNALFSLTNGGFNTAVGYFSLRTNTNASFNTAVGWQALFNNTEGSSNTATGVNVLFNNTTGSFNTASGDGALFSNTVGERNTATGYGALGNSATGSTNTALGYSAGSNVTTASNVICIGTDGANASNSCYIGHIYNQLGGLQAVYVDIDGKLGIQPSSRRSKEEIKPMEQASEAIYRLKPVSFRYKQEIEPTRPVGFGLIAEDVAEVNPELVVRDQSGELLSVRYDHVNAL